MVAALQRLGMVTDRHGETLTCDGRGRVPRSGGVVDCSASGTVFRFVAALSILTDDDLVLDGSTRLLQRPMGELADLLRSVGKQVARDDANRLIVSGSARRIPEATIDASVSGQFVSGLLMAMAASGSETVLRAEHPVSVPFITMTVETMRSFGAEIEVSDTPTGLLFRTAGTGYAGIDVDIEPDIMSGNYFAAAALISGRPVELRGIPKDTSQGDIGVLDVLERMGATVSWSGDTVTIDRRHAPSGTEVDLRHMPDMALTVAAVAAVASSPTTMTGLGNLIHKESDRLEVLTTELPKVGCRVVVGSGGGSVTIEPPAILRAARISTYDDHRVAMAFGLLTLVEPEIEILDPGCVSKTWPQYFEELDRFRRELASAP